MLINWLWVAFGGALGAMARYGVGLFSVSVWGKAFPFGTVIVNITGSFLLAMLFLWQHQQQTPDNSVWLFWGVGVLGAFTTFSTFSLEVILMMQQGAFLKALVFAVLNFFVCIAAVALAFWLRPLTF